MRATTMWMMSDRPDPNIMCEYIGTLVWHVQKVHRMFSLDEAAVTRCSKSTIIMTPCDILNLYYGLKWRLLDGYFKNNRLIPLLSAVLWMYTREQFPGGRDSNGANWSIFICQHIQPDISLRPEQLCWLSVRIWQSGRRALQTCSFISLLHLVNIIIAFLFGDWERLQQALIAF